MKIFGRLRGKLRKKDDTVEGIIGDMEEATKRINSIVGIEDMKDTLITLMMGMKRLDAVERKVDDIGKSLLFHLGNIDHKMDITMQLVDASSPALVAYAKDRMKSDIDRDDVACGIPKELPGGDAKDGGKD